MSIKHLIVVTRLYGCLLANRSVSLFAMFSDPILVLVHADFVVVSYHIPVGQTSRGQSTNFDAMLPFIIYLCT